MQKETALDESLIEQNIDDFINEILLPNPLIKYTEFSFDFDKFSFYLKAQDMLHPEVFLDKSKGVYVFSKHIFISTSISNVNYSLNTSKETLYNLLTDLLNKSEEYQNYLNRFTN